MKAITYAASAQHSTWHKNGYLFENGIFISIFNWFNKTTYYCRFFAENEIPATIGWGKGVNGAFEDYQVFKRENEVELDYNELKSKCLTLPYISEKVSGMRLNLENPYDLHANAQVQEILKISRSKGIQDVRNNTSLNLSSVKFIVVGDNPGITELASNAYFVGASGKAIQSHFESNGLVNAFYQECLILNKCILHTATTLQLVEIRNTLGVIKFNELLVLSARNVLKAQTKLNVPILILGISELIPEGLFYPFWKTILDESRDRKQIYLFKHPSHSHFENQWKLEQEKNPHLNPLELLLLIGLVNLARFLFY